MTYLTSIRRNVLFTVIALLIFQGADLCVQSRQEAGTSNREITRDNGYARQRVFPTGRFSQVPVSIPETTTTVNPNPGYVLGKHRKYLRASRNSSGPRRVFGEDVWSQLARCESGGRPQAVSSNGKYFGAFQFSIGTWHGIGESGSPIDYDYEYQLSAAKRLQARSGWGQWPVCSRKLGLY